MQLSASTFAYLLYCASVALSAPTAKRQSSSTYSGGTTANDVENGVCAPVTLIFARGSTETGNMGSTVGPALAQQLISTLGNDGVAIQGVDYSATIESNISQGADGGPELAKLAKQALQNCPDTKIAIAGYSQGATVCHYAVAQGGLSAADVSSAVLYGDPLDGQAVGDLSSDRTLEFCASGDGVCETGGFAITAAHLSYTTGSDIPNGAAFIVKNAGTSTSGGSEGSTPTSPSASTLPSSAPSDGASSDPFGIPSAEPSGGASSNPFEIPSAEPSGGALSNPFSIPTTLPSTGTSGSSLPDWTSIFGGFGLKSESK